MDLHLKGQPMNCALIVRQASSAMITWRVTTESKIIHSTGRIDQT
jgi:hypothetical protein